MTESIQPFHRAGGESRSVRARRPRIVPLMLLHFGLAGVALLIAAAALLAYLYTLHFTYLDIGWDLRVSGEADLYAADVQLLFAAAVVLGLMSLIQFGAFRTLAAGSAGALRAARAASVVLLLGFPLAYFAWQLELDLPGVPVDTAQLVTRVAAGLLALQAVIALIYAIVLTLPGSRRVIHRDLFGEGKRTPWAWARMIALGVWMALLIAGAIALAVLTDVIELPVGASEPGALLYATSFDEASDAQEWDLYEGRDAARIAPVEDLAPEGDARGLRGQALVITHGSPISQEAIFSALDRKFTDMDLTVTAHGISGPDDNQYGVVFRYQDNANYYAFFISGDGYYSLVKRENGALRDISAWNMSDAIETGQASNTIRIVARGDAFRFYVNGEPMSLCLAGENAYSMWNPATGECTTSEPVTVFRDADFKQGGVALAAGSSIDLSSPVVIAFDNLTISGPEAGSEADMPTGELEDIESAE